MMTPPRFGKYEVLEPLGQGGFGTVYLGRDPALKRLVAIKICSALDPHLRKRFAREAEVAASLQHPSITTVFDFGEQDGSPYLVQEFLSGEDLSAKIARREPRSRKRKLRYLLDIARGLDYAHSRGIVHRDVKPANIRVLDDDRAKIMDFGIAKLLHAESQLTNTGMTMGTAGYLPPEQIRGEPVDQRADIFSFGVLAYELMAGQRPFPGDDISAVLHRILNVEPRPMSDLWPDCPPALASLLRRCLAKRPSDRCSAFGEVIQSLEPMLHKPWPDEPSEASAPAADARATGTNWTVDETRGVTGRPTVLAEGFDVSTFLTGLRLRRLSLLWLAAATAVVALAFFTVWRLWALRAQGDDVPHRVAAVPPALEPPGVAEPPRPEPDRVASPPAAQTDGQASPSAASGRSAGDEEGRGSTSRQPGVSAPAGSPVGGGGRAVAGSDRDRPPAPRIDESERPSSSSRNLVLAPSLPGSAGTSLPDPSGAPPQVVPGIEPGDAPFDASPKSARILVVLGGAADSGVESAEAALMTELAASGLGIASPGFIDSEQRETLVGGGPGALAALGGQHGAQFVVAGRLTSEVEPSRGRFWSGRVVLEIRTYETSSRRLLDAQTIQVGGVDKPAEPGTSALAARTAAARAAGRRAGAAIVAGLGSRTSSAVSPSTLRTTVACQGPFLSTPATFDGRT